MCAHGVCVCVCVCVHTLCWHMPRYLSVNTLHLLSSVLTGTKGVFICGGVAVASGH